jgi:hypothetical protein
VRQPVLLLAVLVLVPAATAAFNQPEPYAATFGYLPGLAQGQQFTVASGALEATLPSIEGTVGLFSTGGARLTGLTRVCWQTPTPDCHDSTAGRLSIHVAPGGSFALRLPSSVDAALDAAHALAMFVDLGGDNDLNTFQVGQSLVAPLVDGRFALQPLPAIPDVAASTASDEAGGFASLDDATIVTVRDGTATVATFTGKHRPLSFAGQPVLAPVEVDFAVVPFHGTGALARVVPAAAAAANEGLVLARIDSLIGRYDGAAESAAESSQDAPRQDEYNGLLQALFNGAILSVPAGAQDVAALAQNLQFVRMSRLSVQGTVGGDLRWTGQARLEVSDGHVQGGGALHGFGFLQMPWWGWLFWVVAIGLLVTRFVLKVDRHHPRFDRLRWIGWVAGFLVGLLVFWLWDLEFRALLGMSVLHAPSDEVGGIPVRVVLLVLELVPFASLSFAAIAPLRLALRNGSILLRQGSLMGLTSPLGTLLGFLFGVHYLRGFLDLILSQILANLS